MRVEDVRDLLAAGATGDELLADYPTLEDEESLPFWRSPPVSRERSSGATRRDPSS